MPNLPEVHESNKNQTVSLNPNDGRTTPDQTTAKIEIRERITREDVRAEPDKFFLFGDNLEQTGYGGQAREMRGEANARGIPTKKEPANRPASFLTDKEFAANVKAIDEAFKKIPAGRVIVVPKNGIGTGLARLAEKAPQTFAYLNEKFAAIGFDNRRGEKLTSRATSANGVVVQIGNDKTETDGAKRLLDLDSIKAAELKLLSPQMAEIAALEINRERALADYADRLRHDYKENKENLRDGFRRLSGALDRGEQITVACSCRNGEICHADVVKMAIEKVNAHARSLRETKNVEAAKESGAAEITKTDTQRTKVQMSPRTQRAVNEILAASENDRILANINQTDGRNRSEQASFLGKSSQFTRDIYERGATVSDGKLLVPQENLTQSAPLAITTQEYAVKRIGNVLRDDVKAKALAPQVVEYGEKISGLTADGETRLKVFAWIYDTLEGKNELTEKVESKETRFENALEQIKSFADEMHSLEPTDKIEFVPLAGEEEAAERELVFEAADENRIAEEIYENAIYRAEDAGVEEIESFAREANGDGEERGKDFETSAKASAEKYELIDLSENFPPLPEDFTEREATRFLTETLPEIDRQLENGVAVKEVLKPFNQNVWQSQKDDALNRLERIYQKQQIARLENKIASTKNSAEKENLSDEISRWQYAALTPTQETLREMLADRSENSKTEKRSEKREPTIVELAGRRGELSEKTARQIAEINVFRPVVIEIATPAEFRLAEETAVKTFFQKTKHEIADRLLKLDEIKMGAPVAEQKTEAALKKELNQIKELKPSFAFKLENSVENVVGTPSQKTMDERNFVQFYVNHQLRQPETRLRFENERYRVYAARLESAQTREAVIKTASEIRAENAALGMNRKDFEKGERANQPRPLTNREMQFLFTETSPAHYTQAMTVARLSYAHAGASRRLMTESLLRGEISTSPETQKLIESLESRLARRNPADAILATKHFFESIKTRDENLKYKNDFDHHAIYRLLPSQERDFVYERAVRQKENLEYRVVYREQQLNQGKTDEKSRPVLSQAEKSFHSTSLFHQAKILGERLEPTEIKSKEISETNFRALAVLHNNYTSERVALIGSELKKSSITEARKVGEILETFAKAATSKDENKTQVKITLPENALVSPESYRELLEKFYPLEARENEKYKFSSFGERSVEDARTKGQDLSLARVGEELNQYVYATETAPTEVFSIEQSIAQDFSKIAEMQREARHAQRENAGLLAKYLARAAAKTENQNSSTLSAAEQQRIVRAALIVETSGANPVSGKTPDEFFRAAQREITLSDFQKFAANEKLIGENLSGIKNQFSQISAKQTVLEENKFQKAETRSADKPQTVAAGENAQQFEENRLLTEAARAHFQSGETADTENKTIADSIGEIEKSEIRKEVLNRARLETETSRDNSNARAAETKPFSLRLYEAEIARAEKELRTKNFTQKILAGVSYSETQLTLNLDQVFSRDEREQMKTEAAEIAKSRLEPKELDADHRKIPAEASRQAIATFKQLEQAHNVFQLSNDAAKINEAFSKLDREAVALNQIRLDYTRAERLAVLRETVKTDIIDLLRKNPELKGDALAEQTGRILTEHLTRTASSASVLTDAHKGQLTELSRVIVEKIESNQAKTVANQFNHQHLQSESKSSKAKLAAPINDRNERQPFVFAR